MSRPNAAPTAPAAASRGALPAFLQELADAAGSDDEDAAASPLPARVPRRPAALRMPPSQAPAPEGPSIRRMTLAERFARPTRSQRPSRPPRSSSPAPFSSSPNVPWAAEDAPPPASVEALSSARIDNIDAAADAARPEREGGGAKVTEDEQAGTGPSAASNAAEGDHQRVQGPVDVPSPASVPLQPETTPPPTRTGDLEQQQQQQQQAVDSRRPSTSAVRPAFWRPPLPATGTHARSALWVRAYPRAEAWLNNVLLPSLRAFWPPSRFGPIYVTLDEASAEDEAVAARLLQRWGGGEIRRNLTALASAQEGEEVAGGAGDAPLYLASWFPAPARAPPNASFPPLPPAPGAQIPPPTHASLYDEELLVINYAPSPGGPVTSGYNRQQYDTLAADLLTPVATLRLPPLPPSSSPFTPSVEAEGEEGGARPQRPPRAEGEEEPLDVIGIVDSDALLVAFPHEHSFFDARGRPRVIPRVGVPLGDLWVQSAAATHFLLGVLEPFRGMSFFPVYVRREHFAALRAHVEALHGVPFVEAFSVMMARGFYSNFNILVSYLFHFHFDAYSWHYFLPDDDFGQPFNRTAVAHFCAANCPGVTTDWTFLDDAAATVPYPRVVVHWKHHRLQAPQATHLVRGFCWSVAGRHGLCAANPWWNAAPGDHELHRDLWDFEFVGRYSIPENDAYYAQVSAEVDEGRWDVDAIAQYLADLSVIVPS